MNSVKYESVVLPDGHLALPKDKAKVLNLKKGDKISIVLMKGKGIVSRCFGMWAERHNLESGIKYEDKIRTGFAK